MFAAAKQVGSHTDDLSAVHASALAQLQQSWSGWVGRSAAALDTVGERWRAATQRQVSRLDSLGDHVRTTGAGFQDTDRRGASRIRAVGADYAHDPR